MKQKRVPNTQPNTAFKSFYALLLLLTLIACKTITAQDLKIGIISDFEENNSLLTNFKDNLSNEIKKTIGSSNKASINDNDFIVTDTSVPKTIESYKLLSQRCDIVIVIGLLATKTILANSTLRKPTLAIGISNVDLQEIPTTAEGTSGKKNFSYILTSRNIVEELTQFYEMIPFQNLAILVHEKTASAMNGNNLRQRLDFISREFNAKIQPVLVSDDIQDSLQGISNETDAVVVALSYEFGEEKIKEISDYLISKSLPSYSPSKDYVDLGILSGLSSDNSTLSILRKLAIMVDDIRRGAKAENLPVTLGSRKQLYFNMETSRKIGFSPKFQTLFTANLIGQNELENQQKYTLNDIIRKSIEENLTVQISQKDLEIAAQNVREATSNYLPTANVQLQGKQINEDATNELFGQSERTLTQAAGLEQVIYSESVIANIRIQKYIEEAQKQATKLQINNTIYEAYRTYLNILLVKSNLTIQKENLEVLKKNLELAQIQSQIGAANKSDVYRWESEVANATQLVIEVQTDLIFAKSQLNLFLNNSLDPSFDIEDVSLEDNLFSFYQNNLLPHEIRTPEDIRNVSKFLTDFANENYPGIKQVDYSIKALERQQKMNKRAYYLPNLSLGVNQSGILNRSGAASEPTPNSNFIDTNWSVSVNLSYPIFDGNRRAIALRKTKIEKEQLSLQKNALSNDVFLNVQRNMIDLVTAKTNINFSKTSANNSWKNFEITQDFYRQGSISIVQLFDAQNAALQAKLNYINSVYQYVLAFVSLENSIGYFSLLANPQEKSDFENRLKSYRAK
ncbi:TolC family protein [Aquimarina sp. MMG016]|uniref:TolC family protein n=1 Tax=Aquimarina sp. MMG016 TaxID=2822690 RepID=UPI001B3A33EC|nr:TolC family protein [Aquimarina sp. MMG016]MBQ4821674.1 TolC family protein [Aquimarina sp. MMG016]